MGLLVLSDPVVRGRSDVTTLPKDRGDREYQKFDIDPDDGHVIVRTSTKGTFKFSGLSIGTRITTMDVGDTPVAIPATPYADRNAMSVSNTSQVDTLYIGNVDVTADTEIGTTSGWECGPNENFNCDISDAVVLYAVAPTGKTIRIKVMEIA